MMPVSGSFWSNLKFFKNDALYGDRLCEHLQHFILKKHMAICSIFLDHRNTGTHKVLEVLIPIESTNAFHSTCLLLLPWYHAPINQ